MSLPPESTDPRLEPQLTDTAPVDTLGHFENTDPTEAGSSEGGVLLGGFRRWRLNRRLEKAESYLESGDVMSGMAAAAMAGSTVMPKPPKRFQKGFERRNHRKTALRQREIGNTRRRMEARADVIGTTDDNGEMTELRDAQGNKTPVYFEGSATEGQRQMNYEWIIRGGGKISEKMHMIPNDRGYGYNTTRNTTRPSDLGTDAQIDRLRNSRYSRERVNSELKAAEQQKQDQEIIDKLKIKTTAASEGKDFRGRRATRRASKNLARAAKIARKLQQSED